MNLQTTCDIVIETAIEAGHLLLQGQREGFQFVRKSTAIDIVTEYDEKAEALILARLRPHFPTHRIAAEESGVTDATSPYTWHIDPIDGTVNYASGIPMYCVSIALYEDDQPLVGVIYDPERDECYWAIRGEGAFLRHASTDTPMRVQTNETLLDCVVATGFPYDRHTADLNNYAQFGAFLVKTRGMRRAGAAALDLAYVAAGRLGGYWEYKVKSWDIGAGVLLVTEAGGRVSNIDGSPHTIAPVNAIIASNGRVHDEMVSTLQTIHQID